MLVDFIVAFVFALVLTWIFGAAVGTTGPWSGFWVFFVMVLLFTWAIGLWVRPLGPALWGVYWLPYVIFGLFVALLIAAAAPGDVRTRAPGRPPAPGSTMPEDAAAAGTVIAVSVFVWIALAVLALAILVGYVW